MSVTVLSSYTNTDNRRYLSPPSNYLNGTWRIANQDMLVRSHNIYKDVVCVVETSDLIFGLVLVNDDGDGRQRRHKIDKKKKAITSGRYFNSNADGRFNVRQSGNNLYLNYYEDSAGDQVHQIWDISTMTLGLEQTGFYSGGTLVDDQTITRDGRLRVSTYDSYNTGGVYSFIAFLESRDT